MNYKFIKDSDNVFILDLYVEFAISFIFLISLIATILRDKKEYKLTKSNSSFLPTIVGLLFVLSFFVTNYLLTARDKSPILIQANYDGGFNGCGFEFREDGTYKFFNGSGLGVDYFRGNFTIKDSIITLDKSDIDNVIKSKFLAIRPYQNSDTTRTKIIFQINDKHEIEDKDFGFIVNEDNRKIKGSW